MKHFAKKSLARKVLSTREGETSRQYEAPKNHTFIRKPELATLKKTSGKSCATEGSNYENRNQRGGQR